MKKFSIGISGQTPKTVEADYFYFDNGFVILAKNKTDAERKSGVMPPMIAAYPQHVILSITVIPVEESPYGGYPEVPHLDAVKKPLQHRRKASVKGKK